MRKFDSRSYEKLVAGSLPKLKPWYFWRVRYYSQGELPGVLELQIRKRVCRVFSRSVLETFQWADERGREGLTSWVSKYRGFQE